MGFLNNWRTIIAGLESTERCLVFDQRGHGRSNKPEKGYAPEDYAGDLRVILDELGWDKIILVGHSMGGRNALHFAATFPDRVEKLVIEDIGPGTRSNPTTYYRDLLGAVPTPFATRAEVKAFFQNEFVNRVKTRDRAEMIGAFLEANLEEKPGGTVDWRFSKEAIFQSVEAGHARDRWDEVRALKMPTLLIHGEKSQELSKETFEKMLESNHLIQGVTIAESGHWVHADQPKRFLAEIRAFAGLID